ncbi:hypothetical protein [Nesterenkonia sp.]|uniref:hypothetical protein n=1 Tax=Nesterenkonia sp. TaxID=704201 RepID=UPI00263748D9|nr:hypothetical protein [Nesterenkonia sp.]
MMIGCYIHHQGAGHLNRSLSWAKDWAEQTGEEVTGMSSAPRPAEWPGQWVRLEPDWTPAPETPSAAQQASWLHWAPLHHPGLRTRMRQISGWIAAAAPDLIVVDVSVEVALLARLHGVPAVSVALPGDRGDRAHQLGYSLSSAVVGFWPASAESAILRRRDAGPRTQALGALSRFDARISHRTAESHPTENVRSRAPVRIALLSGRGGAVFRTARPRRCAQRCRRRRSA